jgi:hypothetical protein
MSDPRRNDEIEFSDVTGRLKPGRLVDVALGMVLAHRRTVLFVWALFVAVNIACTLAAPDAGQPFTPLGLLQSLVIAAISLGLVRTLAGVEPAWRLGVRGLIFMAMDVASSIGLALWYEAGHAMHGATGGGVAGEAVGLILAVLGGLLVWRVFVGLTLWGYGHAYDAPPLSLQDSWRGSRGAAGAVIGATVLIAILPMEGAILLLDWSGLAHGGGASWYLYVVLEACLLAWFSTAVVTLPSAFYRLRRGRGGGALADVFD